VRTPKDIFQALSFANEFQALADIHHFSFVGKNLLKTLILLSVTCNVHANRVTLASQTKYQNSCRCAKNKLQ
jgi:hypothetical protein